MRKLLFIPALLIGCHQAAPVAQPTTTTSSAAGPALTVTAQVDQGKQLYVEFCAKCHGDGGQGTDKGPAVVGKDVFPLEPRQGAKRDARFHTAADVFAWAVENMPGDAPGTLSAEQYLAIFAFDLTANGVKLDKPLDGPTAQAIVLHP
jgi:cytochrome c